MTERDRGDEHDTVMEVIRRARPDDRAAARTPAAQALLEEILSMDNTHPAGVVDAPRGVESPDSRPDLRSSRARRPPRRRALVRVAAAAVIVGAITSVLTVDPDQRVQPVAQVRAALADTAAVGTGRAEVVWRYFDDEGRVAKRGSKVVHFSGGDYAVTSSADDLDGGDRRVDGEYYMSLLEDGQRTWYHLNSPFAPTAPFNLDPRTLLDQLRVSGDFREVGQEDIDGVATTRLQAMDPEAVPAQTAAFFMPGAFDNVEGGVQQETTVTSLELWIGEDNLVRRLDIAVTTIIVSVPPGVPEPTDEEREWDFSFSMRFFDFGAPITIEAPEAYVELP